MAEKEIKKKKRESKLLKALLRNFNDQVDLCMDWMKSESLHQKELSTKK